MSNRVVGIDFGHDAIRAVEVDNGALDHPRVLRSASLAFPADAIVGGEVQDIAAVATTLRQLWQKGGFKTKQVAIAMGNSRVITRDLDVPVQPIANIRDSLAFTIGDMLPMPVENAILDYYPVSIGQDEHGGQVYRGMLIAALRDVVVANAEAVRRAGLELVGVDLIPFALARSLTDPAAGETVALVDIGSTSTTITIATAGVPEFIRILPVGGEDLTKSLMELGRLTREQAEQMKRLVGVSEEAVEPRFRPVVSLVVARTSELLTAVRDTLAYFHDTRRRGVARIRLTGGGSRLGGLIPMISSWMRIPAESAEPAQGSEFFIATAIASGSIGQTAPRGAAAKARRSAEPAAQPAPAAATGTAAPGAPPAPSGAATPKAKPAKEPKAKSESIWNRPLFGGGK